MDPSGKFLYGADASSAPGQVGAFSFNAVQESLSEIQGSPYVLVPAIPATGPILGASGLVIAPSGKFLYAVNQNYSYQTADLPSKYDGSISAFSIDPETGALTPVNGSPFSAGINPVSMVVDPTGHFAYASPTTYTTGYLSYATILGFSIDSSTGALTPFSSPGLDGHPSVQQRVSTCHLVWTNRNIQSCSHDFFPIAFLCYGGRGRVHVASERSEFCAGDDSLLRRAGPGHDLRHFNSTHSQYLERRYCERRHRQSYSCLIRFPEEALRLLPNSPYSILRPRFRPSARPARLPVEQDSHSR